MTTRSGLARTGGWLLLLGAICVLPWAAGDLVHVASAKYVDCTSDKLEKVDCNDPGPCINGCANKCTESNEQCRRCCTTMSSDDNAMLRCGALCDWVFEADDATAVQ